MMKATFVFVVLLAASFAQARDRQGGGGLLQVAQTSFEHLTLTVQPSSATSFDVVRFNERLPSGEIRFEVGALANGKIAAIERHTLRPSEFDASEAFYLRALKQSAQSKDWIIVASGSEN